MFEDLLLNADTRRNLEAFAARPAQTLLISGPPGSGKKYLARHLAAVLLDAPIDKIANHPHFIAISKPADKAEIPIESARQLISKLSLKVPGESNPINRVAVIEAAEELSGEAQNAILKLLEEPPAGSLLILTSSSPQKILPTVHSRMQQLTLRPVGLPESLAFFDAEKPAVQSAWNLSRGAPGLMSALLAEGQVHEMKQAVESAKNVLAAKGYDRLSHIQSAAKDKAGFLLLTEALSRVLSVLQQTNVTNQAATEKILRTRKTVLITQESIEKNTNIRLLALNLALNIPL